VESPVEARPKTKLAMARRTHDSEVEDHFAICESREVNRIQKISSEFVRIRQIMHLEAQFYWVLFEHLASENEVLAFDGVVFRSIILTFLGFVSSWHNFLRSTRRVAQTPFLTVPPSRYARPGTPRSGFRPHGLPAALTAGARIGSDFELFPTGLPAVCVT
jgi:hypothetical protein